MEYDINSNFGTKIIKNKALDKFVNTGKYVSYKDISEFMDKLYPNNNFYLINFSKRFRMCYLNFVVNNSKRIVFNSFVKGNAEDMVIMAKLMGKCEENHSRIIIYTPDFLNELKFHLFEYQIYMH